MKKFFNAHPEVILIGLAVLLLLVLGAYYFWGTSVLLTSLNTSLNIPIDSEKPIQFDIESAKVLNLRLE